MNYYLDALKKYCVFTGRATRKEYWYFILFNFIVALILYLISTVESLHVLGMTLYIIYMIAVILPCLGLTVRRLHDIGKGGGWIFISFVPVIGGIWLLVLMCLDSEPHDNRFGPNPVQVGGNYAAPVATPQAPSPAPQATVPVEPVHVEPAPAAPEVPETPEAPVEPEHVEPEVPETPEATEAPEAPQAPETPEAEEPQDPQPQQ
jgi:uncharacterized membrane protein YhaH (DUF805 family)